MTHSIKRGKQIERPTASATVPTVGQQEITSMGYDLDKTTNGNMMRFNLIKSKCFTASRPSTARMSRPSTARSQQQQQQQEYRHHHQLQGSRPSSVMSTFPDAPRTHSSQVCSLYQICFKCMLVSETTEKCTHSSIGK